MRFTRNIGRGGRLVRFLAGVLLLMSGIAGLVWGIPGEGWGWRAFMILLTAAGAFAMLEGAFGWCALRAIGCRTRL